MKPHRFLMSVCLSTHCQATNIPALFLSAIINTLKISLLLVFAYPCFAQKNLTYLIAPSHQDSLWPSMHFETGTYQTLEKDKNYWLKFELFNPAPQPQTYIVFLPTKVGEATLWPLSQSFSLRSGSLIPMSQRSYHSHQTCFKIALEKYQKQVFVVRLRGKMSIYTPSQIELKVSTLEAFEQKDKERYWWQGIFAGIIIIMALYNFVIYVSVRDVSYFYYVVSIVGVGLYFFFYYGFGIELIWQNAPYWDTYAFAFIVPFTNLARLYFTKSYLHLPQTSPLLNQALNILSVFCVLIMLLAAICYLSHWDLLDLLIDLVGFLGTVVLTMMLLCGIVVTHKGYSPAFYFSLANLILVLGGILFIMRELDFLPDSSFTRYAVQYGVLAQVVLFSLGLSDRLNQTQLELGHLALEKERERKQLLEEQRQLLEQKVQEQTADLLSLNHLKDRLLSIISHDLRNPLVSLDSFLNLLIHHHNRLSEQEQTTLAQKARQSLGNLNQLLSNLLLWSQAQSSQVVFSPQWIDGQPFIENNLRLHSLDLELKNLQVLVQTDATAQVYADAEMFDFIVRNLLGNAIKFSHKNGRIDLTFGATSEGTWIQIKDEGVGMTAEQIEKVFTQKVMPSTRGTAKEKGSGLGLILCREFLEMHNGQLAIVSNTHGTTITCHWPGPK